jgi:hypothetical protein
VEPQTSRSAYRIASPLVALAALTHCSSPETQLVVAVDSDLAAPSELARVVVTVGNGAREGAPTELDLTSTPLPLSFGVEPGEGTDEVVVQIEGRGPFVSGARAPLRRRARTTFVEGEARLLTMFLGRYCAGVTCGDGATCDEGQCVSDYVDPAELEVYVPGDETRRDAGSAPARDAGTPASGIVVTPTSEPTTTESGGVATFDLTLDRQPTSYVVVALDSDDESEGTVGPATVTFTPLDWALPHSVTVTGVDDADVDGDQTYTIVLAPAASGDPIFDGVDPADLTFSNVDDDVVGLVLDGAGGLSTTERGGTASFTVALTSAPTAEVTLRVASDDPSEALVETDTVVFAPEDWAVPRTVTIRGVDDSDLDGPVPYGVVIDPSTSAAPEYAALASVELELMNTDDEQAGITVTPSSGLRTSEDGTNATFTVELNNQPTAPVQVDFTVSDDTEGFVTPTRVTFGPETWQTPSVITVEGIDDDIADGDVTFTVAATITTVDEKYSEVLPSTVTVTNVDDDFPDILVSPTFGLVTAEDGTTATFSVRLRSAPSAPVTIALASDDENEGTVSPASVTLTPANWSQHQTVTVTGTDDVVADGPAAFTIVTSPSVSNDPLYAGIDAPDVQVTNTDDDQPGVLVAPSGGLQVGEDGTTATFTVRLATQPASEVVIALSLSDATEVALDAAALTFSPSSWQTPQTVTVTGLDDDVDDGDTTITITTAPATSSDPDYTGIDAPDVMVTNADDDVAEVIVTAAPNLTTTEAGQSTTFTIHLRSEPTQPVTIGLGVSDATEGSVSPTSLMFDASSWQTPQTITVTGIDDAVQDGDVTFEVVTAPATGAPEYVGLNAPNPTVTNVDDDSAGATVSPSGPFVVAESGATATLQLALDAMPTADVVVQAQVGGAAGQIDVTPATATFATTNWSTPATFTISAIDDQLLDGDATLTLGFTFSSADPNYNATSTSTMSVTALDDGTLAATDVTGAGDAAGRIAVSTDARTIAFSSNRSDLVASDTNAAVDLFVFDRSVVDYERISIATNGAQANGPSDGPAVSSNGRFVAFTSVASNLVAQDGNGARDVFLRDRQTQTTARVSVLLDGTESSADSFDPSISADGRYVAYVAGAGLAPNGHCIAVFDRTTGATAGGGVGTACRQPHISAAGDLVVFATGSSTVATIVVRDLTAGTQTTVSPAGASEPALTPDGRYVAFTSPDHTGVAADTNGFDDVILHDLSGPGPQLVSAAAGGGDGASFGASLTSDAQYVVFASAASNLVASTPPAINLFERDTVAGANRLLASNVSDVYRAAVSPDGDFIVYVSANAPHAVFVMSR